MANATPDSAKALLELSHYLTNRLFAIRSAAGSIRKNSTQPKLIEEKIEEINKEINQISKYLEKTKSLLSF